MKKINFINIKDKKLIFLKVFLIAFPSYVIAFLTEKVVFVVPTIAMMMMIANSIESGNTTNRNRIDDDSSVEGDGDGFDTGDTGDAGV
tara:strand:- start:354 stop:617 length:264 start_codon:yes stop_codon:yes gene_type:complete